MVKGNGENQNNGKNEDYAHLFDKCQIFHEQAYKTEKCLQIQKKLNIFDNAVVISALISSIFSRNQ